MMCEEMGGHPEMVGTKVLRKGHVWRWRAGRLFGKIRALFGASEGALELRPLLVLCGFWFAQWPFTGVQHDASLYTLEALKHLQPGAFANELFLKFGSQGNYTLFPALYAALIRNFGIETSALLVTLSGKTIWVVSFVRLLWLLGGGTRALLALGLLCLHSTSYDYFNVFFYGESLPTPRLLAEALVLLSAGCLVQGRQVLAAVLVLLAVSLHPLMSLFFLPVIAVQVFLKGTTRLRILVVLSVVGIAAVVLLLALQGMVPFSYLLVRFDPEWLTLGRERFPDILPEFWSIGHVGLVGSFFFLVGLSAFRLDSPFRPLFRSVCVAGPAILAVWALGGSFGNVLITQLQPWRFIWIVQVLSCLALAQLLHDSTQRGGRARVEAAFLLAGFAVEASTSLPIMVLGVVLGQIMERSAQLGQGARACVEGLTVCATLAAMTLALHRVNADLEGATRLGGCLLLLFALFLLIVLWLVCPAPGKGAAGERSIRSLVATSLSCGALCCGILAWGWGFADPLRQIDRTSAKALQKSIPEQAVVLSDLGVEWVWFDLRRSHYASSKQLAGTVFSRETAVEGRRRVLRLVEAAFPQARLGWFDEPVARPASGFLPMRSIVFLCQDPVLDFIVLDGKYLHAQVFSSGRGHGISLFSCEGLRSV